MRDDLLLYYERELSFLRQMGAEFDDIPEAFTPPYSLTSIQQDYRTISMEATKVLIEKIQPPDDWKPRQILIPTQLIVRQSCGSPKK